MFCSRTYNKKEKLVTYLDLPLHVDVSWLCNVVSFIHLKPKLTYLFSNGRLLTMTNINCCLQQPTDDNLLTLPTFPFLPSAVGLIYHTLLQKSKTNYLLYNLRCQSLHYTRTLCVEGWGQTRVLLGCATVFRNFNY